MAELLDRQVKCCNFLMCMQTRIAVVGRHPTQHKVKAPTSAVQNPAGTEKIVCNLPVSRTFEVRQLRFGGRLRRDFSVVFFFNLSGHNLNV